MFETRKDTSGNNFTLLNMGKVKGKNYLLSKGFGFCTNPNYMFDGTTYAHFNRFLKYWIIEKGC